MGIALCLMLSMSFNSSKTSVDGQNLTAAGGLLILVARALDKVKPGDTIEILSDDASTQHDLPAWSRLLAHRWLGTTLQNGRWCHRMEKGAALRVLTGSELDWGNRAPIQGGRFDTRHLLLGQAAQIQETARPTDGFAPRGATVEDGSPEFPFDVLDRNRAWSPGAAEFYEQATAGHWDGSRDIPWNELRPLDEELERAICQLMTFLAENEYSALYVPAKWIARIHPHFAETVLFLATQVRDEARHIEVFVKRALANGGGLQFSSASTQASLKTLLEQEDFVQASFLLSVLGEGTFLDLLRYIEAHAPDPTTREIARRTRIDETRHVHFALDHIRSVVKAEPSVKVSLHRAINNRAAALSSVKGLNPLVDESLVILAAGGLSPAAIPSGMKARSQLYETMHENRVRRLIAIGFSDHEAEELSLLHTPNFM
jgi:TusA-related sulfurtransferase